MTKLYYDKFDDSSPDQINAYWSDNVNFLKNHFYHTSGLAYACHFGFMSYVAEAFSNVVKNDLNSEFMTNFKNNFMDVSWTHDRSQALHSMLVNYEARHKTYNIEKSASFFADYISRTQEEVKQDSSYVIFPGSKDHFLNTYLVSLYPSLRNALVSYLEKNKVIVFDKKDKFVRIKNHKFKLEELNSCINCFSSQVILNKLKTGAFTFKEFNQILTNFVDAISIDIQYLDKNISDLNGYIDILEKNIEKQKQEGINGYLLTWH